MGEERATLLFAALVAIVEQESISRARYFSRWLKRKNCMYFERRFESLQSIVQVKEEDCCVGQMWRVTERNGVDNNG